MSLREVRAISRRMYREIAFQAIYGLRSGNVANDRRAPDPEAALRRVTESKLLIAGLLGLVALSVPLLLGGRVEHLAAPGLPTGLYRGSVVAGLLVLELALLWWTGLQVLPTLLGAGVQPLLEALPIDDRTLERAALLTTLRLFDLPALTVVIVTPIAVGIGFGSAWAGLLVLPGAMAVVVVAMALALATGRFYVRHILGSRGGLRRAALRWAYLVLWTLPAFALFGFVTFSPRFFSALDVLYFQGPSVELGALLAAFPFPLAMLPLYAPGGIAPEVPALPILLASAAYIGLLVPLGRWLLRAPRAFGREPVTDPDGPSTGPAAPMVDRSIPSAVVRKDLRTASRTPGFALLIHLPLLNSGAIGLWSFFGAPTALDVFNVGAAAVASSALLAAFFAPAFFAIEVYGYSYTRTLPIPRDALLAGKLALVAGVYLGSAGLVLGLTVIAVPTLFALGTFLFFAIAELAAIVAAALLEYGILFWRAERAGLPITGLYAGGPWIVAVSVPGLVVAGAPLVIFEYLRYAGSSGAGLLVPMALTALLELGAVAPVALRALGRGTA